MCAVFTEMPADKANQIITKNEHITITYHGIVYPLAKNMPSWIDNKA
jgi:hypothetical protein